MAVRRAGKQATNLDLEKPMFLYLVKAEIVAKYVAWNNFEAKTMEKHMVLHRFEAKTVEKHVVLNHFEAKNVEKHVVLNHFKAKNVENTWFWHILVSSQKAAKRPGRVPRMGFRVIQYTIGTS